MEFVIFWIICGGIAAAIASSKGGNVGLAFLIGLLLGPIGIIVAIVMSGGAATPVAELKKCPMCAEKVLAEAVICKHCHHDFYAEFKDTEAWPT